MLNMENQQALAAGQDITDWARNMVQVAIRGFHIIRSARIFWLAYFYGGFTMMVAGRTYIRQTL